MQQIYRLHLRLLANFLDLFLIYVSARLDAKLPVWFETFLCAVFYAVFY